VVCVSGCALRSVSLFYCRVSGALERPLVDISRLFVLGLHYGLGGQQLGVSKLDW
jgi:hypothetical protein